MMITEVLAPGLEIDSWQITEEQQDFFEDSGRVGIVQVVGGIHPQLMAGHSEVFDGLSIPLSKYPLGSQFDLEYRVDAEDVPPVYGKISVKMPD
jgi:hypothetical protein